MAAKVYIVTVGVAFLALTTVFLCFPRSTYSELEKRDLAQFPDLKTFSGKPSAYTAAVSQWFSDSEPYRDELMTMSMSVRDAMRVQFGDDEEAVTFHRSDAPASNEAINSDSEAPGAEGASPLADENAKIADSGIIIVGKGEKVRALMAFGGSPKGGGGYVDLLNTMAKTFPGTTIYAMIAPLASEFYLPPKAATCSKPQKPFLESVKARLAPGVKFVDIRSELAKHVNEDIYLRTDHHWAGLGAHYAAKKLAETAGVPFKDLSSYDKHVIHNFVGSMYGYSKDIAVKKAPEDFYYYTPRDVNYTATYVSYALDKGFRILKESKPFVAPLFKTFKNGSSNAYLTFIGSDQAYVKVKTSTPGNRRLLIIKDSYGNAVPGNLLYSFNEVHVVDFRYFTHNLKKYVNDNKITDIAVCFNVFNAYSNSSSAKVKKMLTQADASSQKVEVKENPNKEKEKKKEKKEEIKTEKTEKESSEGAEIVTNEKSDQQTKNE